MDRYLKVQLVLQRDCKLIAYDESDYNSIGSDIENHVMLDFLIFKDEKYPQPDHIKLRHEHLRHGYFRQKFETEFVLTSDGTYTYYKFVIPTIYHFWDNNQIVTDICDEIFYYKGNIYWFKGTYNKYFEISVDDFLIECVKIEDYLTIYDIVFNNHATQTLYLPAKKLFSICKLNKYLVSLQRDLINSSPCDNKKKSERDFLFTSMYVFDYLKDIGNFIEAQRLLDNLNNCGHYQINQSKCTCCGSN